jgi:hypothetical protein
MPIQEMATPTYFQLAPLPNVVGQSQGSVLFCTLPTSGLTQAVISPSHLSVSEYPQSSFMLPSVGGEVPGTTTMEPVPAATSCFPSAANLNYTSSYRSPNASPYGSPVASRYIIIFSITFLICLNRNLLTIVGTQVVSESCLKCFINTTQTLKS